MYISIHIPKTAGTALAKIFDDTTLHRVIYDYGTEFDLVGVRTCPAEIREHRDFIQSYFQYLHGHFHYLKYADAFPDAPVITTVRNPVDRVVSQYLHILRGGNPDIKAHRLIMDGEMSIVEFSKLKYIGNAQWYYLEGREIEDYDFIFVQEHLEYSLAQFCERFKKPEITKYLSWIGGSPKVNEKPKPLQVGGGLRGIVNYLVTKTKESSKSPRRVKITEDDKRKIYKICERDVDVYRRAKECLKIS